VSFQHVPRLIHVTSIDQCPQCGSS
jgi:hypothetical protein